ncbi:hypothetical protein EGR_08234 [Echinococcus granulosus]|uniref:Uncharacterized protein n=1 Tax=Echinococcus granulosus TaxID=6210 RepID=W6U6R2_ECHGR|nr:hypothetical protein EGR_08234 [Echinococcus granulosus]EUB56928.1 hypothetical protein EGR_08234 [Echinococcus granulosus]
MGGTASTSSVTVNFMMTIINVKDKKAEGRALGSGVSSQIYLCWGNLEAIRASLIFPMLTQSCWFYADVCRKLQMQKWQQAKLIFKANFLTSKKEKFYPEKSYNFWKSRSLEFRFHQRLLSKFSAIIYCNVKLNIISSANKTLLESLLDKCNK